MAASITTVPTTTIEATGTSMQLAEGGMCGVMWRMGIIICITVGIRARKKGIGAPTSSQQTPVSSQCQIRKQLRCNI